MPTKLGERVAYLEATIPPITRKLDEIHSDVKELIEAWEQRKGAEAAEQKHAKRNGMILSTTGGLIGAAVTALADYLRH